MSTVLGILDGSSPLGSHGFVDLDLTLRGGKKKLNGGLRDSFLEAIERSERSGHVHVHGAPCGGRAG